MRKERNMNVYQPQESQPELLSEQDLEHEVLRALDIDLGVSNRQVVVELINDSEDAPEDWNPRLPEHAGGNQHQNVGLDLYAATTTMSTYHRENRHYHYALIETGIKVQLPYGYHMMIASRSGLGFKRHIQAFPGIIDHSYRGQIMVKLYSPLPFSVDVGEKVAQGIIFASQPYHIIEGTVDTNTERGDRGFGSTG